MLYYREIVLRYNNCYYYDNSVTDSALRYNVNKLYRTVIEGDEWIQRRNDMLLLTHWLVGLSLSLSLSLSVSISLSLYLCVCVCVCYIHTHTQRRNLGVSITFVLWQRAVDILYTCILVI